MKLRFNNGIYNIDKEKSISKKPIRETDKKVSFIGRDLIKIKL